MSQQNLLVTIIVILLIVIGILVWREYSSQDAAPVETGMQLEDATNSQPNEAAPEEIPDNTQPETAPNTNNFATTLKTKGQNWTLSRVTIDNENIDMQVNVPAPLTLQFDTAKNSYSGFAGCNNFSGTYATSGDMGFDFGATVSTKKACPATMALEAGTFEAMEKVNSWFIKGDQLVFTSEDNRTEILYSPAI